MKVRLIEPITLRSEPLAAGAEIDVDDLTGRALLHAGHAEEVTVDAKKTQKSTTYKE